MEVYLMATTTNNRVSIQETYDLPSRGLLGTDVPKNVTLRAMSTMDEKMRLSGSGLTLMPDLIKNCIVSPANVDTYKFPLFDIQFLMYKLRVITYGSDYKVTLRCPTCGATKEISVNLDEIPVVELPDGFTDKFTIGPLPVSGDTIECKLLNVYDYIEIERESRRILSKFKDYVGDPEMILNLQHKIVTVNSEEVPTYKIQSYVENMNARDLRFFNIEYEKIAGGYGLDTDMFEVCDKCGSDIEYALPMTSEFFRPTY